MQPPRAASPEKAPKGSEPASSKTAIWDAYWQDSRLNSDGPDSNPDIEAALTAHWAAAVEALETGAAVLDLACGNGAVSLAVARAAQQVSKAISITGIDAAQIDPHRYVTQHTALLKAVKFKPDTRMESLPFESGTFDAVFSQFGIEFGDLAKSVAELARVLKPGGTVIILALPSGGTVIERATRKVKQAQQILTQTKLFDIAGIVAQALHNIESAGASDAGDTRPYLDRFNVEVEKAVTKYANADSNIVMTMVFALQQVLTNRKTTEIAQQLSTINTLRQRLADFVARTETTARAALGDAALNGLKRRLSDAGLIEIESRPIAVGEEGVIAWRIAGKKP